jgi:hypothetical protein
VVARGVLHRVRFQYGAVRDDAAVEIPPQRDEEFSRHRDNANSEDVHGIDYEVA